MLTTHRKLDVKLDLKAIFFALFETKLASSRFLPSFTLAINSYSALLSESLENSGEFTVEVFLSSGFVVPFKSNWEFVKMVADRDSRWPL